MGILSELKLPEDIKKLNYNELETLAKEVRSYIIDVVSSNGGHLAPSLGVVEITIALLRMLDPLKDRIVWDVGHQSYAYKILTDRREQFITLRQYQGISGFNKISESPYDAFGVGHSSTSISASLGMKTAFDLMKMDVRTVAVIGDGSMTAGLAFEGLNHAGHLKKNLVVILNDNEMSISPNVGALSNYLSKKMTSDLYTKFRKDFQLFMEKLPAFGNPLLHIAKKMEEGVKGFFTPGVIFEELGFKYIGPVNGHNIIDIEESLHNAFIQTSPVLIHVNTKKGKGYEPAEKNPSKFHGVSKFDKATGVPLKFGSGKTYTQIFGETLRGMGEVNDKILAITAAMPDGTGVSIFRDRFPERSFDVGIAEQHAITFAAGLAAAGMKPYVALYSTFLQRGYDQVIHDVALQKLPVTFCIDRAGFVGDDGPTHHGVFDLSYLRIVPNMTIMVPKDGRELEEMLKLSENIYTPVAIRYPRGEADFYDLPYNPINIGDPEVLFDGGDITIISVGHIFKEALKMYNLLKSESIDATLINLRFLKPLSKDILVKHIEGKRLIITVEEGSLNGGAGEYILSIMNESDLFVKHIRFGVPDIFVEHGDIDNLRKMSCLKGELMADRVIKYLRCNEKG
ncbi:MAG: 1-deoxy-D-xylulose-5-phosphate synthase [Calditerrivibrio sp.]|nr:1-deoxy-D-xylulose-5-phosphate synthase [Calditerrivibrio sp.]